MDLPIDIIIQIILYLDIPAKLKLYETKLKPLVKNEVELLRRVMKDLRSGREFKDYKGLLFNVVNSTIEYKKSSNEYDLIPNIKTLSFRIIKLKRKNFEIVNNLGENTTIVHNYKINGSRIGGIEHIELLGENITKIELLVCGKPIRKKYYINASHVKLKIFGNNYGFGLLGNPYHYVIKVWTNTTFETIAEPLCFAKLSYYSDEVIRSIKHKIFIDPTIIYANGAIQYIMVMATSHQYPPYYRYTDIRSIDSIDKYNIKYGIV
jgi:hypothetical protein